MIKTIKDKYCNNCGCGLIKTYDGYWCKWCKNEMDDNTVKSKCEGCQRIDKARWNGLDVSECVYTCNCNVKL